MSPKAKVIEVQDIVAHVEALRTRPERASGFRQAFTFEGNAYEFIDYGTKWRLGKLAVSSAATPPAFALMSSLRLPVLQLEIP